MSIVNPQDLSEAGILKQYIDCLSRAILQEFRDKPASGLDNVMAADSDFLSVLASIKKRLDASPYNATDIQQKLENAASIYLLKLETILKNTGSPEAQYLKVHLLPKIQLGIGRALVDIEKISHKQPKTHSPHFFIGFCSRLRQRILGMSQKKRALILSVKALAKTAVVTELTAIAKNNITEFTKMSDDDRRRQLTNPQSNRYIQAFNHSPDQAAAVFPSNTTAQEIATFLLLPGLDPIKIADYLGGDKHTDILKSYITHKYNFSGKEFSESIREFLESCQLPVEGQKIDRVMQGFAQCYCEQNSEKYLNSDAIYLLAMAVVMLNTDAHNPHIKKRNKMTEKSFISILRKAYPAFEEKTLKKIYNNITTREIKKASTAPQDHDSKPAMRRPR